MAVPRDTSTSIVNSSYIYKMYYFIINCKRSLFNIPINFGGFSLGLPI